MSAALFDLALRVAARDRGGPVPRLLHNPAPARQAKVAVVARRSGPVVQVQAVGPDGRTQTGSGAAGLAAIARAAGCAGGDLGSGPTALIDTPATLRALAGLAIAYADPARCAGIDVAAGSALAGWWVERAAHPGTTAVADVLAVSRQRFVLGVAPGADHPQAWRRALSVPAGLRGLHIWHRAVTGGPVLPGLDATREDDDWLLEVHQDAIKASRSWDRPETLHLAAARLATRCDAADIFEAALLADPLWRARGVHTGFVCHGQAVVGAGAHGSRVVVRSERLDTRLKSGTAVIGWPGDPMTAMPGVENRFSGEVYATAVEDGALVVTIGGVRRIGYRPAAGETLTIIPAPPSPSTIRSRRSAVARLYKRRFSWLSQGVTPTAARRGVPLAVLIAAADETVSED
ncbi:hypothetical protein [Mycobacterium xenopi]|uniref:hypothetical protein n=1 Tax=Mycobacterium xenopi TaxID=1789 RepID=UPI000A150B62|nr:hypothetical protein [Mycobacterium xenopi]ORX19442.1 hypothetical protein AWC32_10740 [Mycobacterium xenopi]SPX94806.1 Uncharacterised protein [Mycobacterium xenopi]